MEKKVGRKLTYVVGAVVNVLITFRRNAVLLAAMEKLPAYGSMPGIRRIRNNFFLCFLFVLRR